MIFKLSISNIKKSFKDYTIYFVTLMLGVCIFYIFNSIESQTAMTKLNASQDEMIKSVTKAISYFSIFVAVVLGFLVIYASKFFIKKRNKEFGIYMTLGMSKRNIAKILLLETFMIGLLSLIFGLLIGIPLSQVTSTFVSKMFEVNMSKYTFHFSKETVKKTIIYFGIIYIVVMIFNTIVINKNKLIDLLQKEKKQEDIKIKRAFTCWLMFITSLVMLVCSYKMLFAKEKKDLNFSQSSMLDAIILAGLVLGTVMFFYSLAGIMLKLLSKCHFVYCKRLNTFVFKQLNSRINTMVVAITIICIMLTITLCALPISLTRKDYYNNSIKKYAPCDFQIINSLGEEAKEYNFVSPTEFVNSNAIIKNNTKDITYVKFYSDDNFTKKVALGEYIDLVQEKSSHIVQEENLSDPVKFIGESDYNKMARLFKFDTINLADSQYAVVANMYPYTDAYKKSVSNNKPIKIFNNELRPYEKVIDGFSEMNFADTQEEGFVVVKDNILNERYVASEMLIGNYSTNDEKTIEEIEKKFRWSSMFLHARPDEIDDMLERNERPPLEEVRTKQGIREEIIGESLTMTFLSVYLGIVFLISSSAILALKVLSDSLDDRGKYKTLRQIGSDEKDINKAIFKQTFIFFMLPLLLAVFHTLVILKYAKYILVGTGITGIFRQVFLTSAFLIAIYGIYFIITYICSKNIIKRKMA